eukprot:6208124-Pleurochrysis_carterae.AAC.1
MKISPSQSLWFLTTRVDAYYAGDVPPASRRQPRRRVSASARHNELPLGHDATHAGTNLAPRCERLPCWGCSARCHKRSQTGAAGSGIVIE